jgi:hypothetical protein
VTERYRWRFWVETEAGGSHYLGPDGHQVSVSDALLFDGTRAEAEAEAKRRTDIFEGARVGFVDQITCEGLGRAGPS